MRARLRAKHAEKPCKWAPKARPKPVQRKEINLDTVDYVRLDKFLASDVPANLRPQNSRPWSDIMALHDVSCQPAWSSVLVLWAETTRHPMTGESDSTVFKVALLDYCPDAEVKYRTARVHRDYLPFRSSDAVQVFDTGADAYACFIERMRAYADDCGY